MRIAVDMDDTVVDQSSLMLMLMNWKLGTNTKPEELKWDFFHVNPETEKAFWDIHNMYDSSYLRRAMAPVDPYAFPVLKELQRVPGNKVEVLTRNKPESVERIRGWLFMHGVEMRVRAMGRGGGKAQSKASYPYDIFIDDAPGLADEMKKHPTKRLIVFDRPWNRDVKETKNVVRARGWLEVRKLLRTMEALE
jgi:5'(3')-deoxyribonucleotidase